MTSLRLQRSDGFELCDDNARLDMSIVHGFLENAYWSTGIPVETIERAIQGSWCFGLYAPNDAQIGFARLITDYATYAYLADVFIVDEYQGRGLATWMMGAIFDQKIVQGLRRITLATRDGHRLYKKVGFRPLGDPGIFMEIARPEIYSQSRND